MNETDPTLDIKHVPRPKTGGFHQWTEDEIQKFEAPCLLAPETSSLVLLICTGLRRGDAARPCRQHIRSGIIQLPAVITGTAASIPALPELHSVIEACPTSDLAVVATHSGRAFTKEAFENWFKKACAVAGVSASAHGFHKAGATRAAECGATAPHLNAIFGWTGSKWLLCTPGKQIAPAWREKQSKNGEGTDRDFYVPTFRQAVPSSEITEDNQYLAGE